MPDRDQVNGSNSRIDWSRYPDHHPRYLAGEITLAEAQAEIEAARAQQATPAGRQGRLCQVCRGLGVRDSVPSWARQNLETCPRCQGSGVNCPQCAGLGRVGGERVTAPPVPCSACKGSGTEAGGGDVLWELPRGRELRASDGTMGVRTAPQRDLWDLPGRPAGSDLPEWERIRRGIPQPEPPAAPEWAFTPEEVKP